MTTRRPFALIVAVLLTAAAPPTTPEGFVDLAQLVATHPQHAILLEYDREIAALRSTQNLPDLAPVATANNGAGAVRREAAAAQLRVRQIATRNAQADRGRERAALTSTFAPQRAGDREMNTYSGELARETTASFTNYVAAIAERTERAYAARAQQLRERENTLAFDLARRDAAKRLSLRLKLTDLHLAHAARAPYVNELAALDEGERNAVSAQRGADAAVLAAYRRQLESDGRSAEAQMIARLRTTGNANLAIRRRVTQAGMRMQAASPSLRTAAGAFGATYSLAFDAQKTGDGLRAAGDDISARFAQLAGSASRSERETANTIGELEAIRAALYRSIVTQITSEARLIAHRRGLAKVAIGSRRPGGSVDLTRAVRAGLAAF
jgi:hypothetical protein